jgi:DnaJ-class molecular chaperone
VLKINVKKGWKEGKKIKFKREGEKGRKKINDDIVLIIREKNKKMLKREGSEIR